jgi:hypothetical protein
LSNITIKSLQALGERLGTEDEAFKELSELFALAEAYGYYSPFFSPPSVFFLPSLPLFLSVSFRVYKLLDSATGLSLMLQLFVALAIILVIIFTHSRSSLPSFTILSSGIVFEGSDKTGKLPRAVSFCSCSLSFLFIT